jgi:hypothetical protein
MSYKIIEAASLQKLEEEVNRQIKAGWKPQGGVVINVAAAPTKFLQAMITNE